MNLDPLMQDGMATNGTVLNNFIYCILSFPRAAALPAFATPTLFAPHVAADSTAFFPLSINSLSLYILQ